MMDALLKRMPNSLRELPVAVIMGGHSIERDFSLRSGRHIVSALENLGMEVHALEYDKNLKHELDLKNITLCLLATHGVPGEDGKLQGYLESIDRYYSGASVAGSALAMNKIAAKAILKSHNIKTPNWLWLDRDAPLEDLASATAHKIGFPLVIKPTFGGSSIGVRLVKDLIELRTALAELFSEHHHLFVEEYIEGRELTVSTLEDPKGRPFTLPIMELQSKNLFYDFESKWSGGAMEFKVPAEIEEGLAQGISEVAIKIHKVLMQRDHSRSDFILNNKNELYYLETNSIPGLTENSDLPAQAKAAGMTFEEVVISVLMGPYRRLTHDG